MHATEKYTREVGLI